MIDPILQKQQRFARLTDFYSKKLKELVDRFYENQNASPNENHEALTYLNKQWKQIAYKANLLNKGLNILPDAFEKTITHNHFIFVILQKQPLLTSEYLNTKDDLLLQELSENDEQLEAFTKNYLHYLELQKENNLKNSIKKAN